MHHVMQLCIIKNLVGHRSDFLDCEVYCRVNKIFAIIAWAAHVQFIEAW